MKRWVLNEVTVTGQNESASIGTLIATAFAIRGTVYDPEPSSKLILGTAAIVTAAIIYFYNNNNVNRRQTNHDDSGKDSKTVKEVLKGKKGSIKNAPLPQGSPSWEDIQGKSKKK